MTDPTPTPAPAEPTRTALTARYAGASGVQPSEDGDRLALATDLARGPVFLDAGIRDAIRVRECLSALHAVVSSDLRYTPKDQTAYLAWRRMKQQSAGLGQHQAQQAYFDWLARNDPDAWLALDPVVTVHPDAVVFEVFSKDEGSYAQVTLDHSALALAGDLTCGTTHIDFSDTLFDGLQRLRSDRPARLVIGADAVALQPGADAPVIEKRIQVPDAWLRGFLQVQSAALLADTPVELAPIDLYNALRHLRLNADQKKGGRGVRFELVPGEAPRLVLEPWETVIDSAGAPYAGRRARVIRVWGRRRVMLRRRALPFADSVTVHLLGTGLPSFIVLRCGPVTVTLGLSGFTASNWSAALSFDVCLPRPAAGEADPHRAAVVAALAERHVASVKAVAQAADLKPAEARAALQRACQHGQVMYDLARDQYRHRPLVGVDLDPVRLAFRGDREKQAHDLLHTKGAVKIVREVPHLASTEVVGDVAVAADGRTYRVSFHLDDEGRIGQIADTSPFFRQHGLKHGPSAPLIALRLAHAQAAAARAAQRGKGRQQVQVEARTYTRRRPTGEEVHHLALDRTRLRIRWGLRDAARPRLQQLVFDSVADARAAYFERVDALEAQGFLDASAG